MRVVSYNLRKHRAADELDELAEANEADIVCLQEADTQGLPDRIGGLALAEATRGNRLGLAVYHRENAFKVTGLRAFRLKKSMHDRILRPAHERVLGVRLHDIDDGRQLVVASFHAAPLTALNRLRRHQIRTALDALAELGENLPILMVGDYNYPVFKENLGQVVRDHGYTLTLSDDRTYTRYRVFKGHYDFATSIGFDIDSIRTLPQGSSDHRPILVETSLAAGFGTATIPLPHADDTRPDPGLGSGSPMP